MANTGKRALADYAAGLQVDRTPLTKKANSVFDHYHGVSALTRGAFEKEVWAKIRPYGKLAVIGAGKRESKLMQAGDHACRTDHCYHDVSHQIGNHDWKSCVHQADTLVSTDLLYYQTPEDVAQLLRQHGAARYVTITTVPYVGGAGTLFGEARWDRVGPTVVRVVTDPVTRETWQHDDLVWAIRDNQCPVSGGETLVWSPVLAGGQRLALEFALTRTAVKACPRAVPTLEGYVAGGPAVWDSYGNEDVAYTAAQVYSALGRHSDDAGDGLVSMKNVRALLMWLQQNPSKKDLWRTIAAQRCRALGVVEIVPTVELAVYCAEAAAATVARGAWYKWDAAWRRKWRAWIAWALTFLPYKAVLGLVRLAGALLGVVRRMLERFGWRAPGKWGAVQYRTHVIHTKCIPTVGTVETERGKLVADEVACQSRPAYQLAGMAVLPNLTTTSCGCPMTMATGFAKRVLHVELPDKGEYGGPAGETATMDDVRANALHICGRLRALTGVTKGRLDSGRPTFSDWVGREHFTEKSRLELRDARNYSDAPGSGVKAFVKKEIVVKMGEGEQFEAGDHKPRVIQPVPFSLRSQVGPSIYGSTDALKAVMSCDSSVYFTSGATGEDLGRWFDSAVASIDGPAAFISADYGNFDGTNFIDGGQTVAAGVKALLGMPPTLASVDYAARRRMVATYGMRDKYGGANCTLEQVSPTVTSGHDDTTNGNSATNAVVHRETQSRVYGEFFREPASFERNPDYVDHDVSRPHGPLDRAVDEGMGAALLGAGQALAGTRTAAEWDAGLRPTTAFKRLNCPAKAAVMGDDGIVVLPAADAKRYMQAFTEVSRSLAFVPEASTSQSACDAEFCSMLAWPSADGTVFGPKIGRIMLRTGFKRMGDQAVWQGQLRGDATGLAASVAHIPILRVWCARVLALTSGRAILDPRARHKVRAQMRHEASDETWAFATERYGLTRDELEELEQQVASVSALPAVLHHPAWYAIVLRDS